MKKFIIIIICLLIAFNIVGIKVIYEKPQPVPAETEMTVDDVVSKAGCDYFIVKEIDTWAVLEDDVYMDRPVTEINICDDMEDTLCIFIDLADDEEPHVRKVAE